MVIPIDGAMTARKPLMLKDFLELDDADAWDGFCSAASRPDGPTVRHLLNSELSTPRLTRSKTTLTRISHVIHAITLFSSSKLPVINPHSQRRRFLLPKILRWRKRERHGSEETADVDDRPSSSSDDHETHSSDFTATVADVGDCREASPPPAAGDRRSDKEEKRDREMACSGREEEEEKEGLSPVSVMDFPVGEEEEEEEEEEATISPRFHETLDNIERTRQQLLEKIRRFESLAELDLDLCSSSSEEEEEEEEPDGGGEKCAEWDMLCQLKARVSNGGHEWWSIEKVLLSFFAEGLSSLSCFDGSCHRMKDVKMVCCRETAAEGMMAVAIEWIGGGRRAEDVAAAEMRETRWMRLGWEEEVAMGVEIGVLGLLMEELVLDLVSL